MKKLLLSLVLTIIAVNAAGSEAEELLCELANGTTVAWQLTEQPQVEMLDGQFVVSTTQTTVFYAAEDVSRFTLNKTETGIEQLTGKSTARPDIVYTPGGQLVVNGCQKGEAVSIYAADGRLVLTCRAAQDGPLTVGLDKLPTGVYIVKLRVVNFKIAKR